MNNLIKYLLVSLLFQANFALASINDVAPFEKNDWRNMLTLARQAYQKKDYQKAILFYETLLPSLPKDIDLSEEIAQTRYRLKQYDTAAEVYQKKSKTDQAAMARSFHNLGNIAMEKKDYKKAIDHYQNALRKNPTNERTRYNLSEAIRRQKEDDKKSQPPEDDSKDKKQKDKPQENNKDENNDNPSALNDQSVQRELDKLMKKEAETKRKVASGKGEKGGVQSQKDW
jgi:Ca-activated chloride channel family protein